MDASNITIHRPTATPTVEIAKSASTGSSLWGSDGFGFGDLLDIVNPLQHIPVVSNLYRGITGDEMGGFANVVGSTLFGGPLGGGMALANEIIEGESGKTLGGHISNAVLGDADPTKAALASDAYKSAENKTSPNIDRQRSTTHSWIYAGTHMA